MDQALVAEIVAGEAYGSGYLVAPRLVLTAAHLVGGLRPHEQAQLRFLSGAAPRFGAAVSPGRRPAPDTALDAALLEICRARRRSTFDRFLSIRQILICHAGYHGIGRKAADGSSPLRAGVPARAELFEIGPPPVWPGKTSPSIASVDAAGRAALVW
jgi:hypothetical protein